MAASHFKACSTCVRRKTWTCTTSLYLAQDWSPIFKKLLCARAHRGPARQPGTVNRTNFPVNEKKQPIETCILFLIPSARSNAKDRVSERICVSAHKRPRESICLLTTSLSFLRVFPCLLVFYAIVGEQHGTLHAWLYYTPVGLYSIPLDVE